MRDRLRGFFTPPTFPENDEKNRQATLLYHIANMIIVLALISIVIFRFTENDMSLTLILLPLELIPSFLVRWLVQRGRIYSTAVGMSIALWCFTTFFLMASYEQYQTKHLIYIAPVMISGLLLGEKWLRYFIGASFLASVALLLSQIGGPLSTRGAIFQIDQWVSETFIFVAVSIIFWLALRLLSNALEKAARHDAEMRIQQEHLGRQTALLNEAQRIGRIGSWDWDITQGTVTWSEEIYRLLRFGAGQNPSYQAYVNLVHPEDQPFLEATIRRALAENSPYETEHRILFANGDIIHVYGTGDIESDAAGRPIRLFGIIQDITERKRAEEKLRQSEERYRTISELMLDYAYSYIVGPDGTLTPDWMTEESFLRVTGYAWGEAQKTPFSTYHPDDEPKAEEAVKRVLKGERVTSELRILTKTGELRWLLMTRVPVWDETDGRVVRFYGIGQNITERKLAEEKLRQSEERYRTLSELMLDYAYSYVIEPDGTLTPDWITEDSFERLTGYRWQEAQSTLNIGFSPEDAAKARQDIARVIQGESVSSEYRYQLYSGQMRWISLSRYPVWDEKEQRVTRLYGIAKDITERKLAEEALEYERNMLRTLIDAVPQAIYIKDAQSRFITANARQAFLAGYQTPLELVGKTDLELFPVYGEEYFKDEQMVLQKGGTIINKIERIGEHSGEERWHQTTKVPVRNKENQIVGLVGIGIDITDQKQAEARLEAQLERIEFMNQLSAAFIQIGTDEFEKAIEVALEVVVLFTGVERGSIFLHSDTMPVFELVSEWSNEGIQPYRGNLDRIEPFDYPELIKALAHGEIIKSHGALSPTTIHLPFLELRPGQNPTTYVYIPMSISDQFTGWVVFDGLHKETMFSEESLQLFFFTGQIIASAIDRKQSYEEIRQLNSILEQRVIERTRQLEAANRELESFAYSVSHDLRAPLRSIDGFSLALLEDYEQLLDETGQDFLRRIRAASQRMGRLIDDLLKLSRVTRNEMRVEPVNLSETAQTILAELQSQQPGRATKCQIEANLIVNGDANLLYVMLENLLGNAWKFSQKKDTIEITFGRTIVDHQACFYIQDKGAGFDMAHASKLFGAFQRLHTVAEFEGTGIGLATVQRIIRRHGGEIWAESTPNQGATFYFMLRL